MKQLASTVLRVVVGLVLIVSMLRLPPAFAQEDQEEAIKQHFNTGSRFFRDGKYTEAAAEFLAAYNKKPVPELLYNAAACYEAIPDANRAIELFERYLAASPRARDRKDVESRIARMQEVASGKKPTKPGPAAAPVVKSIVVIDSKPPGATIYLDDKTNTLGETPWSGTLEGSHTIYLEAKGYKPEQVKIDQPPGRLEFQRIYVALSEQFYLGWLEVRSNVAGADVYIDDKTSGVAGRTPYMANIKPGKHKIFVTREGWTEEVHELEIEAGKAHTIESKLEKAPIGFVQIVGATVEGAEVLLDGKKVCTAPCRFQAPAGDRRVTVRNGKRGLKPYSRTVNVGKATESLLSVKLQPKPARWDVVWNFGIAAVLIGGGVFCGLQANKIYDELEADIRDGDPLVTPGDGRFTEGKIYSYAADGLFVLGGIAAVTGIISLLIEKGPRSSGVLESRDLGFTPVYAPGYAGASLEVKW